MAKLSSQYTRSLFRALDWRGTWLPSESVALGDVGTLKNGLFQQQTTLAELGVRFSKNAGRARASFHYQSTSGVSVRTKVAGEASPYFTWVGAASAGVRFGFSRRGAVVFSAPSCQIVRIAGPAAVRAKLRRLPSGHWNRDWVFISGIVKATRATILVARSKRAAVELRASTTGAINVAKIGTGFALAGHQDMEVTMVATGSLVPLYQVLAR